MKSSSSRSFTAVVRGAAETLRPSDRVIAALTTSAMASAFSNGVFYTVSALFFTRVVGLSIGQVGLGLTVAGAVAIAASFVAGRVADRVGAPIVLLATTVTQGLALCSYILASTAGTFTLIASVAVASRAAQGTARAAVLAQAFTGSARILVRARIGVVINIFFGVGTACAGLALINGTAAAYTVAVLIAGTLVLASTWPLLSGWSELANRLSVDNADVGASPASATRPSPLRDRTYVIVSALNALLSMHAGVLTIGVPLWITNWTSAPPITITLLLLVNSVLVVTIQTPIARRIDNIKSSARAVSVAGLLLAMSCVAYSGSAVSSAAIAILLLLSAGVLHTLGEVVAEIGSWGLAFDLAPANSTGAYQGLNQASVAAGAMLAPLVVTVTALDHGGLGWLVLGVVFVLAGGATHLAVRARHSRITTCDQPV